MQTSSQDGRTSIRHRNLLGTNLTETELYLPSPLNHIHIALTPHVLQKPTPRSTIYNTYPHYFLCSHHPRWWSFLLSSTVAAFSQQLLKWWLLFALSTLIFQYQDLRSALSTIFLEPAWRHYNTIHQKYKEDHKNLHQQYYSAAYPTAKAPKPNLQQARNPKNNEKRNDVRHVRKGASSAPSSEQMKIIPTVVHPYPTSHPNNYVHYVVKSLDGGDCGRMNWMMKFVIGKIMPL